MMKKPQMTIVGALLVAASLFISVAPASAATYSGPLLCTGTKFPKLQLDSLANGNGAWYHYDLGTVTPFAWNYTGFSVYKYGPYQRTNWNATSSAWAVVPYAACIQG